MQSESGSGRNKAEPRLLDLACGAPRLIDVLNESAVGKATSQSVSQKVFHALCGFSRSSTTSSALLSSRRPK
jgi:hypothetical protein